MIDRQFYSLKVDPDDAINGGPAQRALLELRRAYGAAGDVHVFTMQKSSIFRIFKANHAFVSISIFIDNRFWLATLATLDISRKLMILARFAKPIARPKFYQFLLFNVWNDLIFASRALSTSCSTSKIELPAAAHPISHFFLNIGFV
jgi:hypothetical protein